MLLESVALGGETWFSLAGGALSGVFLFGGVYCARSTVRTLYKTADGKRIGFKLCNWLGFDGETIEVPLESIRIIDSEMMPQSLDPKTMNMLFIRAQGVQELMLICDRMQFYESNEIVALIGKR